MQLPAVLGIDRDALSTPSSIEGKSPRKWFENVDRSRLERWFGWWRNRPDRFAALIAIFTACLFAATYGLWDATKDLVKDARENSERQLRAYVGLHNSETTVYPFEKGGYAFIADAELRNYGQTPAYDLTVNSNAKIDVPEVVPFDDFKGAETGAPSIAFRDASFHVNVGWPISDEDKKALYERKKVVFFWGNARYRDAFDKWHHFTFRLVSGQIAVGTGGVYTMGPYQRGYDAD